MVALFTRAWIEMVSAFLYLSRSVVALFTRAWIEITSLLIVLKTVDVALFTRAWIEIKYFLYLPYIGFGRPLHEGVD